MKSVFTLIDHPHFDDLFAPVIQALMRRGIVVTSCVVDSGRGDLLARVGIPFVQDLVEFDRFLATPGQKLFLNGADHQNHAHRRGRELDARAAQHRIPSVTLEHSILSLTPWDEDARPFDADFMALIGAIDYEQSCDHGFDPDWLVVTGFPKHDSYLEMARKRETVVREHRRILGLAPGQGYIYLAGANHYFTAVLGLSFEDVTQMVASSIETVLRHHPALDLLIKPHPAETAPSHGTVRIYHDAVSTLAERDRGRVRVIDPTYPSPHLILGAEVVITFSATVMLDSLMFGKQAVLLSGPTPTSAVLECASSGAVVVRSNWDEVHVALEETLRDFARTGFKPISVDDVFIERFTYRWDGKASERIAYFCDQLLQGRKPRREQGIQVDFKERQTFPEIGFERYQRLMGMAEEVSEGMPTGFNLLDVGGFDAAFGDFVPGADYVACDEIISSATRTLLPFDDGSMDVVMAADVLEHVLPEDRNLFLCELMRVARRRVVFSFPNEIAEPYESFVLSLFPEHTWLKEHHERGLPKNGDVEAFLGSLGVSFNRRPNSSLGTWVYSVLWDSVFDKIKVGADVKARVDQFLQEHAFEMENREPAYRSIYTIEVPIGEPREQMLGRIHSYVAQQLDQPTEFAAGPGRILG